MAQDTGRSISSIKADGGASDNAFLTNDQTEGRYKQWLRAVERAKGWATPAAE